MIDVCSSTNALSRILPLLIAVGCCSAGRQPISGAVSVRQPLESASRVAAQTDASSAKELDAWIGECEKEVNVPGYGYSYVISVLRIGDTHFGRI